MEGLRTEEGSTLKPGREAGRKRRKRTGQLSTDSSWAFGWQGWKTLSSGWFHLLFRLASRVEASLEVHQRHLEEAEAREKMKMEWQHAALVIDR